MSSPKRSIISRILSWFGLVSAVKPKPAQAGTTSANPAAIPAAVSEPSPFTGEVSTRQMAARLATVSQLNAPSARAPKSRKRVSPAMKALPKREVKLVPRPQSRPVQRRTPPAARQAAPEHSAEIVTFKPKAARKLDRAA